MLDHQIVKSCAKIVVLLCIKASVFAGPILNSFQSDARTDKFKWKMKRLSFSRLGLQAPQRWPAGPSGAARTRGPSGPPVKGPTGPAGATGADGIPGLPGTRGATGATGAGVPGATGTMGATTAGETGATGGAGPSTIPSGSELKRAIDQIARGKRVPAF